MDNEKFLEALNNNPRSKALLHRFNVIAAETNMTDAEYKKARQTIVLAAIAFNDELRDQLALEIWLDANK